VSSKKQKKASKTKVKQTNLTMKIYGVESNDGQKQVEAGESIIHYYFLNSLLNK
jgi:hypothetical protein